MSDQDRIRRLTRGLSVLAIAQMIQSVTLILHVRGHA